VYTAAGTTQMATSNKRTTSVTLVNVVHIISSRTAKSEQALHEKSERYQDLYTSILFDVSTVISIRIELLTAHLQMT
jgi:hypothetical protein